MSENEKGSDSSTLEASEGLPAVRRVPDERGSHIEPPLDSDWPQLEKLRWHAAVVEVDCGLSLRVYQSDVRSNSFTVFGAASGSSHYYTYDEAWLEMNALQRGAEHLRAQLGAVGEGPDQ